MDLGGVHDSFCVSTYNLKDLGIGQSSNDYISNYSYNEEQC